MVLKSELEIREKELKALRSHYFEMKKELIRTRKKHQGYQDYIDSFVVQINSKKAELDIEREELRRAMAKVAQLETMVRVLEKSNETLATSNKVLITDNTLFHDKKRRMTKQINKWPVMLVGCNNKPPKLEMMIWIAENTWVPSLSLLET